MAQLNRTEMNQWSGSRDGANTPKFNLSRGGPGDTNNYLSRTSAAMFRSERGCSEISFFPKGLSAKRDSKLDEYSESTII